MTALLAPFAGPAFGRRLALVALLLTGLISSTRAADEAREKFVVGLGRSCFPNVNLNDATAAYRVFLQNIGRRRGYEVVTDLTIHENTSQFAAAIERGNVNLAAMDAWQFIELEHLAGIRPYFVPIINGRVGRRYLVLARRDGTIRSIADLPGQAVLRLDSLNNGVCTRWLESLLPESPDHPASTFFDTLERAAKPTAAVLPVYFNQKAACIVDEGSFELMKELNPQVGNSLVVIAASDPFVDAIICLGEQRWTSPQGKVDTLEALSNLADDPAGRQVLNLFRIAGLVAFHEAHLDTVRALQRQMSARQTRPGPPPPAIEESTL